MPSREDAESRLQPLDPGRDRGLAYPQNLNRPADGTAFSDRDECPDLDQVHGAYIVCEEFISKGLERSLRSMWAGRVFQGEAPDGDEGRVQESDR